MERSVKLMLTVVAGAGVGRSWEVPCGVVQRVGATGEADVVMGGDEWMAGAHFALYWVGEECRVRDLSTGRGTWVNGRGVQDEVLRAGDVVQCGGTQLRVGYGVEGGEMVAVVEDPKARALAALRGLPGKLYAVLDTARDPELLPLLRRSGYRYECLYSGWTRQVYGNTAPYLVQLSKNGKLLEQSILKEEVYYISSKRNFNSIKKALKGKLVFHSESGPVLYRFYDPTVPNSFERESFSQEGMFFLMNV